MGLLVFYVEFDFFVVRNYVLYRISFGGGGVEGFWFVTRMLSKLLNYFGLFYVLRIKVDFSGF